MQIHQYNRKHIVYQIISSSVFIFRVLQNIWTVSLSHNCMSDVFCLNWFRGFIYYSNFSFSLECQTVFISKVFTNNNMYNWTMLFFLNIGKYKHNIYKSQMIFLLYCNNLALVLECQPFLQSLVLNSQKSQQTESFF